MRKCLILFAAAVACVVGADSAAAIDLAPPANAEMPGATMVFQDEFNGRRVNSSRWSTLRGATNGYGTPYNPDLEAAAYASKNVTQRRGKLVLTLRRRSTSGYPNYPYSSGMVHSGKSFAFKQGYVEARVRVPKCAGCWPGFWMLEAPVDRFWPPEIDIFEFFNSARDDRPFFNFHFRSGGQAQESGRTAYGSGATDEWHTYGLRWSATSLQVFFDGAPGPSFNDASLLPARANYLIFNLGLFKKHKPRSGSKMAVDWVRVWR
ncbi:MAG: glycoside hydrolase family 16 protein [Solirubrobacterales bacterium]